jgi:hypothetical protein
MRLPGDATLVVVIAHRREWETDEGERRLAHMRVLETAWERAGLPIIHLERTADGASGGVSGGSSADLGETLRMTGHDFFLGSGLEDLLTRRGATTVVLCGFLGETGGETADRQACALGFRTFVVADAALGKAALPSAGRDAAIEVDTITAQAAAEQAGAWRREAKRR